MDTNVIIMNTVTNEWFETNDMNAAMKILKDFLKPLTGLSSKQALINEDVGESRWKRTDKIIIVPSHLKAFVRSNTHYINLYIE